MPSRLGRDFRLLLASSWITNLGDGLGLAAGPLLVASQTRSPQLIALGTGLQWLPALLFGLYSGVIADRLDRKLIIAVANTVRAAVLLVLALIIVGDQVNVTVVLAALFVLGAAETFVDNTSSTVLPMIVERRDLGVANARLMFGHITVNRLIGPPLGAAMFAVGMALPFAATALLALIGVVLVVRIATSLEPPPVPFAISRDHGRTRRDIAEGIRWLWNHPPMRTLTIMIVSFNVTFGAAWSVLVLLAIERLGLDEIGFGLLTTVGAVGGLIGTSIYGWLERHLSIANIMRIGLTVETLTHLGLALSRTVWVSMAIFFVFGAHEAVWSTVSSTIRQRAVPNEFQGRVTSVYTTGVFGGLVIGAAVGGVIASIWGVTGPFWFAFVGSALIFVWIWNRLDNIAHAGEVEPMGPDQPAGAPLSDGS